jgi:peptide/nickel transport system substrate-binding protein
MPERIAKTDAFKNIEDPTGSGPFRMVKEEWVPGNKVVYVKNTAYVPRKEPPSWASGGKVVKVDRVEWIYIPDSATAAAALNAGEADIWEQLPPDLIPVLSRNKDVTVRNIDPLGSMGMIRFNFLHPPFNNEKLRQAVLYMVNQQDYVIGIAGDPKNGKPCYSYFTCGTPLSSEIGAEPLKGKRDLDKAKQLVKESGYKGEKIVIIDATDQPIVHSQSLLTLENLKKIGVNAEIQAGDWGTLITRRAVREPPDKGGWNIFHTWTAAPDMLSPALNIPLRANGDKAWFGWPTDPKLEELIDAWFKASDPAAQKKFADEIQTEAYTEVPYVPTGQFVVPTAYRKNLDGIIIAPVVFLWNVDKK